MPNVFLQALSSGVSDHCPLLIAGCGTVQKFRGFRFEEFWPRIDRYHDIVASAWQQSVQVTNPFLRLHIKLQRTSKALRGWSRKHIGRNKIQLRATSQLIAILEVVLEHRQLSVHELRLKRDLK